MAECTDELAGYADELALARSVGVGDKCEGEGFVSTVTVPKPSSDRMLDSGGIRSIVGGSSGRSTTTWNTEATAVFNGGSGLTSPPRPRGTSFGRLLSLSFVA